MAQVNFIQITLVFFIFGQLDVLLLNRLLIELTGVELVELCMYPIGSGYASVEVDNVLVRNRSRVLVLELIIQLPQQIIIACTKGFIFCQSSCFGKWLGCFLWLIECQMCLCQISRCISRFGLAQLCC